MSRRPDSRSRASCTAASRSSANSRRRNSSPSTDGGSRCPTPAWIASSASTRVFLRTARSFFLFKEGEEPLDSRGAAGLCAAIRAALAGPVVEQQPWTIDVVVTNTGRARWLPSDAARGGVRIGAHLYTADGAIVDFDLATEPLTEPPHEI